MVAVRERPYLATPDLEPLPHLVVTTETFSEFLMPEGPLPKDKSEVAYHLHLPGLKPVIQALYDRKFEVTKYSEEQQQEFLNNGEGLHFEDPIEQAAYLERRFRDAQFIGQTGDAEQGVAGYYDPETQQIHVSDFYENGTYARVESNLSQLQSLGKYPVLPKHTHPPGKRRHSQEDFGIMRLQGYEGGLRLVRASLIACPPTDTEPATQVLELVTQKTPPALDEAGVAEFIARWDTRLKEHRFEERQQLRQNLEAALQHEKLAWQARFDGSNRMITDFTARQDTLTRDEEVTLIWEQARNNKLKRDRFFPDEAQHVKEAAAALLNFDREAENEVLGELEDEMKVATLVSYDMENFYQEAA